MDDQPRSLPSAPSGATVPSGAGTNAPAPGPVGGAGFDPRDFPGQTAQCPGRRVLRPGERALVCLGAAVLAVYLVALVVSADWGAYPVLAALTAVTGVGAMVALLASAWVPRPDQGLVRGRPLRWVERPARRDLARELRAGRPGPPKLRPAAVAWTGQTLQAPWGLAIAPAAIAINASSLARSGPVATWQLVALAVVLVGFALLFGLELVRCRAAHRVADALERLTPPPPLQSSVAP